MGSFIFVVCNYTLVNLADCRALRDSECRVAAMQVPKWFLAKDHFNSCYLYLVPIQIPKACGVKDQYRTSLEFVQCGHTNSKNICGHRSPWKSFSACDYTNGIWVPKATLERWSITDNFFFYFTRATPDNSGNFQLKAGISRKGGKIYITAQDTSWMFIGNWLFRNLKYITQFASP